MHSICAAGIAIVAIIVAIKKILSFLAFLNSISRMQTAELRNTPEFRNKIQVPISKGSIPRWLNGIMYRIGPGKYQLDDGNGNTYAVRHAFDGMPFLHRFEISGLLQQVTYNSRHLAEKAEKRIVQSQGVGEIFFAHMPRMTWWSLFKGIVVRLLSTNVRRANEVEGPSSRMVGVTATPNYPLPERWATNDERVLVAKTDGNLLQKIHPDSLDPQQLLAYDNYHNELEGQLCSAHHQHDPYTQEYFNLVLNVKFNRFTVFKIDRGGRTTILAKIKHRRDKQRTRIRPSYIHGFWLTKDFVILPEMPLYLGHRGAHILLTGTAVGGFYYDVDAPSYLHIISRRPGEGHVATIPVDHFFMFHPANAWNTDNQIVLDGAAFTNGDIVHKIQGFGSKDVEASKGFLDHLHDRGFFRGPEGDQIELGQLQRIVIQNPLGASPSVKRIKLAENIEFPRFNQMYTLNPYRYVYGISFIPATDKCISRQTISKVDTHNPGRTPLLYNPLGCQCSEPIFVPRPNGQDEDDGVILSFVSKFKDYFDPSEYSYFVVLNAKDLTELTRCDVGDFTATTFHGSYVDDHFESIAVA